MSFGLLHSPGGTTPTDQSTAMDSTHTDKENKQILVTIEIFNKLSKFT
jgi:hypothetical protein